MDASGPDVASAGAAASDFPTAAGAVAAASAFCSLTSFREEVRTTFGTAVGLGGATGAGRDAARSAPSSIAWYAALAAELFRTSGFAKVQREMKLFLELGRLLGSFCSKAFKSCMMLPPYSPNKVGSYLTLHLAVSSNTFFKLLPGKGKVLLRAK